MFSPYKLFYVPLLVFILQGLHCTSAGQAKPSQPVEVPNSQKLAGWYKGKGLLVAKVNEGGPAQLAGFRFHDVITRYGEFEILDDASYFAARDKYEKSQIKNIEIVFWRSTTQMKTTVPSGPLGMETYENDPASIQFYSIMNNVDVMFDVREDGRERQNQHFYEQPEKVLGRARALLDQAEKEGTLTPAQLLVARIYSIRDDAAPEELKEQAELLAQLRSTQPHSYVAFLGALRFFPNKRYRAAIECYKQYLNVNPSDVSTRLNLGIAYNNVGQFEEADAAAEYVFTNRLELSDFGHLVAYQVKAKSALGRRDYSQSIHFAQKAFELDHSPVNISLVQLAAAQSGDMEKLAGASRKFKELMPADYEKWKAPVDAVEAFALAKSNRRENARKVIMKWKNTDGIESKLKQYWKRFPTGSDVLRNWNELMEN